MVFVSGWKVIPTNNGDLADVGIVLPLRKDEPQSRELNTGRTARHPHLIDLLYAEASFRGISVVSSSGNRRRCRGKLKRKSPSAKWEEITILRCRFALRLRGRSHLTTIPQATLRVQYPHGTPYNP